MGATIVWGFVVILSAMQPNKVGHYGTMTECYTQLSAYITNIESVDKTNQYRGACQQFPKIGQSTEPSPNTQWLTSTQLIAKATP
jgi:hypothetical protein